MHLRHSLRKLELALHDFGVFEIVCKLYVTHSPNNIAVVEIRLNQGFADKMQSCQGKNCLTRLIAAVREAIFLANFSLEKLQNAKYSEKGG